MIKASYVASTLVLGCLWLSSEAIAGCSSAPLNQSQLLVVLSNNTVCAVRGSDRWQELHQSGGALIDYKLGPGHPVDPSETVGSWSIVGTGANATVVYNYGSGGTYTYKVYPNGGNNYSFCVGATELLATVKTGGGTCP